MREWSRQLDVILLSASLLFNITRMRIGKADILIFAVWALRVSKLESDTVLERKKYPTSCSTIDDPVLSRS